MLAYLKSFVYNDLDINKYSKILEFVPKHEEKITNQLFSDEELIDHIRQFCISEKTNKFVISLSGGIDSMVLISIIQKHLHSQMNLASIVLF